MGNLSTREKLQKAHNLIAAIQSTLETALEVRSHEELVFKRDNFSSSHCCISERQKNDILQLFASLEAIYNFNDLRA
jgi:hypothetical protein